MWVRKSTKRHVKVGARRNFSKSEDDHVKKLSGGTPRKFVVLASCLVFETFILGPSTVKNDAAAAELMAGCPSQTRDEHPFSALDSRRLLRTSYCLDDYKDLIHPRKRSVALKTRRDVFVEVQLWSRLRERIFLLSPGSAHVSFYRAVCFEICCAPEIWLSSARFAARSTHFVFHVSTPLPANFSITSCRWTCFERQGSTTAFSEEFICVKQRSPSKRHNVISVWTTSPIFRSPFPDQENRCDCLSTCEHCDGIQRCKKLV